MEDAPKKETPGSAPDPLTACKFRKVRLSGILPSSREVEAMMNSLEARGASHRVPESPESRPQAVADGGALATVVSLSGQQKQKQKQK